MASDSPAAGNAASPEVAKRPAIIPGKFQDHAEAAWDAWYEPEQDFARAITTSTHDEMHRAFLAAFEVAAKAERRRIRAQLAAFSVELAREHEPPSGICKHAEGVRLAIGTLEALRD